MSENILVTGGAGYIGSHACKKLRSRGFIPICFDNLSTGWQDSVKFGPFVYGDLCKKDEVDKVFSEFSPIAVMHFAALSQVGESVKYPELYWQNNVLGSLNLIQSAISNNCKILYFPLPVRFLEIKIKYCLMRKVINFLIIPMVNQNEPLKICWLIVEPRMNCFIIFLDILMLQELILMLR